MMGSRHGADPGTPAWVDLGTAAGTAAAARFYCGLFGWKVVARHRPLDDEVGYWTFRQGEEDVGGLVPAREASWTAYIAVRDVDAMASAVIDNGGAVVVGPTVVDPGRMTVCTDPLGASFVMWEPDQAGDVDPRDQAASFTSYQAACRDIDVAKRFYAGVFGWEANTARLPGGSTYTELFHGGTERRVATMVGVDERGHAAGRARWMFHLEVSDVDRLATDVAALGGVVSVAPFDLPEGGRLAVLGDPERAAFSVLQAA